MRKSFNGLSALVKNTLAEDPISGHLFVFINRKKTYLKVLYFDRSGYCIWARRLEQGRFHYRADGGDKVALDCTGSKLLLEGIGVKNTRQYKRFSTVQNGHAVQSCAMHSAQIQALSGSEIKAPFTENEALRSRLGDYESQIESLRTELDGFKRQLFGEKSEKRHFIDPALQADLLAGLIEVQPADAKPPTEMITYERRKKSTDNTVTDAGLRFDNSVPVETIVLPLSKEAAAIPENKCVSISEKVAQRTGSYVILKYVRPVIRHTDTGKLFTAPASHGPDAPGAASHVKANLGEDFTGVLVPDGYAAYARCAMRREGGTRCGKSGVETHWLVVSPRGAHP